MVAINTVLMSSDEHLHRVLWMDKKLDIAYLFDMTVQRMPYAMRCSDIDQQTKDGAMSTINDPFLRMQAESKIPEKSKQVRDQIWVLMEDIVVCEPDVYDKGKRSGMISKKAEDSGKQIKSIHRYLKQYWLHGKSKNAFLPQYSDRGGKGQERPGSATGAKRGRPRKYDDSSGRNVDEETKLIFEKAVKKYYH